MRKRDIILDFTSLLDVTLIIIFFFVIFSNLDAKENQAQLDKKVSELSTAISVAEEREETAEAMAAQLESEIETVRNSDERRAANLEEMLAYGRSGNIKLLLVEVNSTWILRVTHQDFVISELPINDSLGNGLITAIGEADYNKDDTIFCDFVYDGSQPGTAFAYRNISDSLDEVTVAYPFLYCSETDLSIGEE